MRSRRRRTRAQRRARRYIGIAVLMILLFLIFFETAVKTQLTSMLLEELETVVETSVIDAVDAYLTLYPESCDELVEVHYTDGTVGAITTNAAAINRVKTAVSSLSQQMIADRCRDNGVTIPLGGLTGLVFLADIGPRIRLNVESKQTVRCSFESTFTSAGVNQTLHHIILTVDTELTVYSPYRIHDKLICSSSFEIAQTVIVGEVPSYSGVITY